jgi:outer membrane immunogenic protein
MMKRALATLAMAVLATPALAGDGNGPPPALWSGFYVGANAGYAWDGNWDVDLSHTTGALIYSDPFDPNQVSLDKSDGFIGGGQIGANKQFGNVVIGVEADASWTDLESSGTFTTSPTGACAPNACTQWEIESSLVAMGTVRGRLGLAAGRALFYGTGGLAWGITDADQTTHHNGPDFATPGAVVSGDSNHIGWTAGGGIEYALGQNISLKAEYLYVDLGEADYHLQGTTTPGGTTPWAESFSQDLNFHTARIGLNYKFD